MRFLFLLILVLGAVETKAFADAPVVHTQNGDVLGVLQGSVESFKKLPFAAPPVGDLRWKPPQDPADWLGVRDGSKFGDIGKDKDHPNSGDTMCPQRAEPGQEKFAGHPIVIGSEDCLYLNVFRPRGAQGLPVIVFIHGGHNAKGSAGDVGDDELRVYDGSELALNGNVVVVTINYRLGALGFMAHPALSAENKKDEFVPRGASGNYGYMDQLQALKWVNRNIAAFGGDPNKVTLLGQSSGGGGVLVLMASPLSKGCLDPGSPMFRMCFHRAIIQSGQFAVRTLKQAEDHGHSFAQALNCKNVNDVLELQCLRNKSATDIVFATPGPAGSVSGPSHFVPVVGGDVSPDEGAQGFLPDFPLAIIRGGKHHHVPLLIGNVEQETSWIYGSESRNITEQNYKDTVKANYGSMATQLLNMYPAGDYGSPREAYNAIGADRWFVCPAQRLAKAVSASQSEFVGRFLYTHVFSKPLIVSQGGFPKPIFFGAGHGDDLAFVFGTFGAQGVTPTADELTLKGKFQRTWTDFAKSGSPGNFWDRYDANQDNYAIFDTSTSIGRDSIRRGLRTKQCDYWDNN